MNTQLKAKKWIANKLSERKKNKSVRMKERRQIIRHKIRCFNTNISIIKIIINKLNNQLKEDVIMDLKRKQ